MRVIHVQQAMVVRREAGEGGQVGSVAGHRIDTVHRDHPRRRIHRVVEQLGQVLGVVVPEPDDGGPVAGRVHRTVVHRLVRPAVQEDRPIAHEHGDHRRVDVSDGREHEDVRDVQELRHLLFDLGIHPGIAQEPRP